MRLGAEKPLSAFAYYTAWLMYIGLFFVKHQCKYAKNVQKMKPVLSTTVKLFENMKKYGID